RALDPLNPLNRELVTGPSFDILFVGFNAARPPFDDAKVRQAFCYAVDKDKIVKVLLQNTVKRADGILPPGMPGYNEALRGLQFDPEKARELISESKYGSVSNLTPITFTTSGLGESSPLYEAIIGMWKENLGVNVEIRQIDPEKYPYVIDTEKDELFEIGWAADYPDPQNFLDLLFHTGNTENTGEYSNPAVDSLLDAAREETDETARLSLYQEAEQMLVDDAACLPLFFGQDYTLVKPYVKGFVSSPLPIPWLKYISIEPVE
ncbi:MAG: peptide ABC transporter substrate-binding protein, partial [Chloroflexi bacterium]|nr:peptide ABC transporter substrate-binding protein [Chloroflexota bacterium]